MKSILLLSAVLLVFLSMPETTWAEQVTCESRGGAVNTCRIDTRYGVRLVRQLSDARCREGSTYSVHDGYIRVNDGCRGVFESESRDSGYSQSGGSTTSTLPNRVTCESISNQKAECPMDTRGEVRMIRQLSKTACVDGRTWGASKHSIWVTGGCRGEFASSGTGPAYDNDPAYGGGPPANAGGVPPAYVRACNAVQDRFGEVVSSSPLKPGHWEVILMYDDGKYVCNAGPNGEVTYFERLRNQ